MNILVETIATAPSNLSREELHEFIGALIKKLKGPEKTCPHGQKMVFGKCVHVLTKPGTRPRSIRQREMD